jgi:hypothetical protein
MIRVIFVMSLFVLSSTAAVEARYCWQQRNTCSDPCLGANVHPRSDCFERCQQKYNKCISDLEKAEDERQRRAEEERQRKAREAERRRWEEYTLKIWIAKDTPRGTLAKGLGGDLSQDGIDAIAARSLGAA